MKMFYSTGIVSAMAAMFVFTQSASASSYNWNDAASGNWSTPADWSPTTPFNGPQATDTVIFANADESTSPSTVNNTVDSGSPGIVSVLNFTDFGASGGYDYPVTFIPTFKTLLVTNTLLVGGQTGSGTSATFAYFYGGGTLKVTGPTLLVSDGGTGAGPCAYLNLAGLTNFIYNNPSGTFGVSTNGGGLATRIGGSATFAYSNNITAGVINLGTESTAAAQGGPGLLTTSFSNFGTEPNGVQNNTGPIGGGTPAELVLGPGTNLINAKAINIAALKNGFIITNSGGGVRIRGVTGADSDANVNITVGLRNAGGGSGQTTGWLMLNGCPVNIKANNLILGDHTSDSPSGASGGNGLLEFDTGTISANSLLMADNVANNNGANTAVSTGLIDVGSQGTFLIGAGQLFALATAAGTGPAVGILIVSNGVMNCQGPIVMGVNTNSIPSSSAGFASGIIQLIGSGTLNMGPNSYVGTQTNPITGLLLDTNSVFSISIPSASYTNVCVDSLAWPSPDTNLTLSVAAIPAGITNGELFPFLSYSTLTNSIVVNVPGYIAFTNNNATSGAFNDPKVVLPIGVTGNMFSSNNNVIYLTLTSGTGLGYGGVPELTNGFFIQGSTFWTALGNGASIVSTNSTYPNTGGCGPVDARNIVPLPGTGTNVAKLTGSFVAGGSTNIWSETVPVAAGSQVTMGASTYVAHEDIMSGADSFYYEVDFVDGNNNLVGAYQSGILTNLNCSSPILDTWDLMAVTNEMQVTGGINTGVVAATFTNALIRVPAGSVNAQFKAVFIQRNATDTGSVYFSGANIGFLQAPVPPAVSSISPNLVTLCTNEFLSCTVTSAITTISSFQVTATTTILGAQTNLTTTYTIGSPGLTTSGLGTPSATVFLALATNTVYQSVSVTATDADNLAVSSPTVSFDTLSPVLVIEAGDFNFSSGGFLDTPANGGLALYQGKVGNQGIDENKIARAGGTQSYYRPSDATIVQAAGSTSGTEQKFVTAAANGDTTDIEVAQGNDTNGDWLNYSRTYGPGGSAPTNIYNVWCYLATSGSGAQVSFAQVLSNPSLGGQTTNILGSFGSSTFSDSSYFNYVYTPLVGQFGNLITLTLTNGVQTFQAQIINGDTPNVAFYMLVPAVPVYTPVFLNVYPNQTFEPTNTFTFTIGQAQGAAISTNGIGVIVNGVAVTSGLTFTALQGGGWTVNYAIQSNDMYTIDIDVTNEDGFTNSYTDTFDTFNLNNYHWMAVDYDFSTNINSGTGGSVGDGWTGGQFINNPVPTGDSGAIGDDNTYQFTTNSYFSYPSGLYPGIDPSGFGAVAQESIDVNWATNTTQDPGLVVSNSIYRLSSDGIHGDGVGSQVASDTFLLPEFLAERTNILIGRDGSSGGPDVNICEFNVGYFYAGDWLNYTHTYPTGTFNVWGRLGAGGGAFSGCTLSLVTSGVGTSNQTTQVLGTFSDANPAGWQIYHWIELVDTNNNPVYLQLSGKETLRLTAPTNATSAGNGLNPLFFMLAPATAPASPFSISASLSGTSIVIHIPTQSGHNYTLWHAATLTGTWTQVGSIITGNGSVQTVPEPASSAQGFYEVTAQ
jgi:hypothetical protein